MNMNGNHHVAREDEDDDDENDTSDSFAAAAQRQQPYSEANSKPPTAAAAQEAVLRWFPGVVATAASEETTAARHHPTNQKKKSYPLEDHHHNQQQQQQHQDEEERRSHSPPFLLLEEEDDEDDQDESAVRALAAAAAQDSSTIDVVSSSASDGGACQEGSVGTLLTSDDDQDHEAEEALDEYDDDDDDDVELRIKGFQTARFQSSSSEFTIRTSNRGSGSSSELMMSPGGNFYLSPRKQFSTETAQESHTATTDAAGEVVNASAMIHAGMNGTTTTTTTTTTDGQQKLPPAAIVQPPVIVPAEVAATTTTTTDNSKDASRRTIFGAKVQKRYQPGGPLPAGAHSLLWNHDHHRDDHDHYEYGHKPPPIASLSLPLLPNVIHHNHDDNHDDNDSMTSTTNDEPKKQRASLPLLDPLHRLLQGGAAAADTTTTTTPATSSSLSKPAWQRRSFNLLDDLEQQQQQQPFLQQQQPPLEQQQQQTLPLQQQQPPPSRRRGPRGEGRGSLKRSKSSSSSSSASRRRADYHHHHNNKNKNSSGGDARDLLSSASASHNNNNHRNHHRHPRRQQRMHETIHAQSLLLGLAFCAVWTPSNLMAPNLTQIATDFGFTDAQRDLYLGSYCALATGVLSFPISGLIGILADLMPRNYLFCATVAAGALASIATGLVPSYTGLFVARLLNGACMSGSVPVAFSFLGDLFATEERNAASSGLTAMMGLGIIMGQVYAGVVGSLPELGWRHAFFASGSFTLFFALLCLLLVQEPERGGKEKVLQDMIQSGSRYERKLSWKGFAHAMTQNRSNLILLTQGFFSSLPWGIIFVFLNDYLSQERGFSVPDATFLVFLFGIGCAAGGIIGGYCGQVVQSWDRRYLPLFMAVTTALGILPFLGLLNLHFTNAHGFWGWTLSFFGGMIASLPSVNVRPCLLNVNLPEMRGASLTAANVLINLGRGFGPSCVTLMGHWWPETMTRQNAFNVTLTVFWFLSAFQLMLLANTLPHDQDEMERQLTAYVEATMANSHDNSNSISAMAAPDAPDMAALSLSSLSPMVVGPPTTPPDPIVRREPGSAVSALSSPDGGGGGASWGSSAGLPETEPSFYGFSQSSGATTNNTNTSSSSNNIYSSSGSLSVGGTARGGTNLRASSSKMIVSSMEDIMNTFDDIAAKETIQYVREGIMEGMHLFDFACPRDMVGSSSEENSAFDEEEEESNDDENDGDEENAAAAASASAASAAGEPKNDEVTPTARGDGRSSKDRTGKATAGVVDSSSDNPEATEKTPLLLV